jgi:hypothetical protein
MRRASAWSTLSATAMNSAAERDGDELRHAPVDLAEKVAGRRIKGVVEVEYPGVDVAETGVRLRRRAGSCHGR